MADTGMETGTRALPRVHWGAVVAGVLIALAAHVVLGLIGAAFGLAAEPADSDALGAGAAIWGLLTPLVATLIGAWVAARMAEQWDAAGSNLHGVLVWSIGLIAGALFLTGTLATGAVSAGTAASGNAGALRQALQGPQRVDPSAPRTQAGAEQAQDDAGKAGAAALAAAAMASLAGLLGAFLGAGLARARRDGARAGRGLGWRIALQRTDEQGRIERERAFGPGAQTAERGRAPEPARPFGSGAAPGVPGYERGPGEDPYPRH